MRHFTIRAFSALLLFTTMLLWQQKAYGQLVAGDLAIIGYNFDNPDAFTVLALKDIPAGQVLFFTDNGWRSSGSFRANEGTITWTNNTGSDIPCGSTIEFTGSSANIGATSGSVALSGSGDQILVYRGSSANPTFITALHSNGSTWESDATDSNTSAIPTGLTDGLNAISIPEVDNGNYNCTTVTGSPASLRSAIFNSSNWTTDNSRIPNINPCHWTVTCTSVCATDADVEIDGSKSVTVDFTGYDGSGFAPCPAAGQLDADSWWVTGLSDGSMSQGDTQPSGDFARGTTPAGFVTTGGVYALTQGGSNPALWIQPGGSDFTPGTINLAVQNNSGSTLADLDVSYDILFLNDEGRANSLNFSWSTDGASYTLEPSLDFTTEIAPIGLLQTAPRSITLNGVNLADGATLYLRWTGDDVSGSGSRDEYGLDNITIEEYVFVCEAEAGSLSSPSGSVACGAPANIQVTASGFESGSDYSQTYALADASGNILSVEASGAFNGVAAGNYQLASINYLTTDGGPTTSDNLNTYSNGICADIESKSFNVSDPQPAFNNPPSQVCENGVATFTLTQTFASYAWSAPGASIINGGGSSDNFADVTFGSSSATVSVNVTDANGCTAQTSQAVTIGSTADLAQQGCSNCGKIRLRLCQGDPIPDLAAYIINGNSSYVNGYSLNWYADNNGSQGGPIGTPSILTNSPGTYNYFVTQESPDGCESNNATPVRVRVRPTPNPQLSMPSPLCEGVVLNLINFVSDANNRADRYDFYEGSPNSGGTFIGSATATNGVVNFGQIVTYTPTAGNKVVYVVATNEGNPDCSAETFVSVIVNAIPVLSPVANQGPVCPGEPVDVSFSASLNGSSFFWINDNSQTGLGTNGLGDISFTASSNTSGQPLVSNVIVRAFANGCVSTPISFSISLASDPVLASGLTDMVCSREGTNIDLAGNSLTGMNGETYKWAAPTYSGALTLAGSEQLIAAESFESPNGDLGFSAPGEFDDGSNDLFTRLDGSRGPNYIGADGTFYWAAEDVNDDGGDLLPTKTLTLDPINISGALNPRFEGLFAAGRVFEYDALDFVIVEYNVDGNGWVKGLEFRYVRNGDDFNEPIALDTDNDGIGDGAQLTNTFAPFGFSFPAGNSVQIRVTLRMDGGDEEIAFDNLQVFGTLPGGSAARPTASANPITDGYINNTGMPQTVTYQVVPVSALGCEGDPVPVIITVKPEPVVAAASASVCSGEAINIALSEVNNMPGVSYSWPAPDLPNGVFSLGTLSGGNASSISGYAFVNTTGSPQDVSFEVSATSGAACQGQPTAITVTVAPAIQGSLTTLQACEDAPGTGLATFDLGAGPVYQQVGESWSAIATPSAFTSGTASVFSLSPYNNNCAATWTQIDLTVNPSPLSPGLTDLDVCEGESTKIIPGAPGPQPFEAFYEFDNSTAGVSSLGAVAAQDATFGPGVGGVGYFSDSQGGQAYAGTNWNSSSLNPDDYLEVCISPASGFALELTSISFRERRSGSGPFEMEIQYSTDGFATPGTLIPGTDITLGGTTFNTRTFNFATPVAASGSICLRIYGYDGSSSQGTWRFDDLAVQGNALPQLGGEAADFMWTFEGNSPAGSSSSANGTASNAGFGTGTGNINYFGGNGGGISIATDGWSTGALVGNDYFEFCVSAASGYTLDLTDLEFDERRSGSGPRNFEVYYSLDGFATAGILVGSASLPDNGSWRGQEFSLNISGADQVCFRVYGFNAESGGGTWRFDNLVVSGSVNQTTPPSAGTYNFYDADPASGSASLLASGVAHYDPQTAGGSSQTIWVSALENGCESPALPVVVNVKAKPNLLVGSNSPICEGEDLHLTASGQAIQYSWTGPLGYASQMANNTLFNATPAQGGIYELTGTDGDNCANTIQINVDVQTGPHAGTGVHLTVANTDPVLNLFPLLQDNPDVGGVWAAPNGNPLPSSFQGALNPATALAGYYTYTVTGTGACSGESDTARILLNVTGAPGPQLQASVLLEGPYDAISGLMNDGLRQASLLPTVEPYTGMGYSHVGGGYEFIDPSLLQQTGNDAIVDWVVLEIRDAQQPARVLATRSALLQRDGDIVDVDGSSAVAFNSLAAGNYLVAVVHRNHLSAVTAQPVSIGSNGIVVDFSNTPLMGIAPALQLGGKQVLFAGDADGNGQIQNTDDVHIWRLEVGASGYRSGDYDLDGQVQNSDRMLYWYINVGSGSQVPR